MFGWSVGDDRRGRWIARGLAALSTLVVTTAMALAGAAPSSAAPAPHLDTAAAATAAPGVAVWHEPRLTKLAQMARKLTTMHVPYSSGGHGSKPAALGSSVDCSGLVRQLYQYAFGVDIGRGTGDSMVRTSGKFVKTSHPVPGDVVLFGNGGRAPAYHAMIYVGKIDGQPTAVASPDWGQTIKYQYPTSAYWAGELMGYWHYKGSDKLDSAASLTQPSVTVKLTSARSGDGTLIVTGYAFDPMNPSRSLTVDVYASGHKVARVTANQPSADTDNAYHITGNHRIAAHIPIAAGAHQVRLLAYNIPYDRVTDAWSAQRTATVTKKTVAVLWSVRAGTKSNGHGTLRITGYGYDALSRGTAPTMQILLDGKLFHTFRTNLPSPAMNKAHKLSGNHQFDVTIHVPAGKHSVQLRTLTVNKYSAVGASPVVTSAAVKTGTVKG